MIFKGYVVYRPATDQFLSKVKRTHYGSRRCFDRNPMAALVYRSLRRAREAYENTARETEMCAFELYEDNENYYLACVGMNPEYSKVQVIA